jgi:ribulose-5-phosphate 4-epimerase/fuculose-1-phosphate aldolase
MSDTANDYNKFVSLSSKLGSDFNFIQASGGNTSIKIDDTIHIKSSGTWLADSINQNIFTILDLIKSKNQAHKRIESDYSRFILKPSSRRPSMEAGMHCVIDKKYIFHFHHLQTLFFLISRNENNELKKIFSNYDIGFLDYTKPGLDLTNAILQNKFELKDIIFLKNHGVIVSSDSFSKLEEMLHVFEKKMCTPLLIDGILFDEEVSLFQFNSLDQTKLISIFNSYLYPDQVVFLNNLNTCTDIASFKDSKYKYAFLPEYGLVYKNFISKTLREMLKLHFNLCILLLKETSLNKLTSIHAAAILNMTEEKFRKSIEK